MLMFSPFVGTVATHFADLESHTLTLLSPEAVASRSGWVGCQRNWSTLSVWPLEERNKKQFGLYIHWYKTS